jgi:glucose-1-phosphate cytidylyltransferase
MKTVILAGGFGTRISEETHVKPKPMIEIGGFPILWHIMKIYSAYGINEFVVCCGYKGYVIKEYFSNYFLHMSDVTIDLKNNHMTIHEKFAEPWKITLVDTGLETQTGGRLKRVKKYLDEESFCFTYGDGVSNINIKDLVSFHKNKKKIATVTAVQPPGRFGTLNLNGDNVVNFKEKISREGKWINGGFFIFEKEIIDHIENDSTVLEKEPLETLAKKNQLCAYKFSGFWQPIDTLRDQRHLENLWNSGKATWKVW